MLFMMGARQSGKTITAQKVAAQWPNSVYFNWNNDADRIAIMEGAN